MLRRILTHLLRTGGLKYSTMLTIESLKFDNLALKALPVDKTRDYTPRSVPGAIFSLVEPTPVDNPTTVAFSDSAMALLDLSKEQLERADFADFFSGNKRIPGTEPAAHCYCGHQFGYFSGQLGDGATMYLGEVVNSKGERHEIQFKGAGLTPFSRSADGRKVLRSSIREFLCSEAIHHLGIATTRAGSCVTSDSRVVRDIFYDGNPIRERCTVILRIAKTFIRFGSFEIFKSTDEHTGRAGPSVGRDDILRQLTDYVIETFYPEIWAGDVTKRVADFYAEVVRRTARLVANWQAVGWCHGVLNTDNMSITGDTIDYGPFGFMDTYDPDFICNASDDGGRYTYSRQPEMCRWNCEKLGEALQPLLAENERKEAMTLFDPEFEREYLRLMRAKLGLLSQRDSDKELVERLFQCMAETGADFTNTFLALSKITLAEGEGQLEDTINALLKQCSTLDEKKELAQPRMNPRQFQMFVMLAQSQPELLGALGVPPQRLKDELDRRERREKLENVTEENLLTENTQKWRQFLTSYSERLKMDITADDDVGALCRQRQEIMSRSNPRYILRNHIAEEAIRAAETKDFSLVRDVLDKLTRPYDDHAQQEPAAAANDVSQSVASSCQSQIACSRPPSWARQLRVT